MFRNLRLPAQARRIELRASIAQRLPPVSADLGMIERVLTNLLDNAIRHTPVDGFIEVDLGCHDSKISVSISDTGPGIPGEPSRRAFPAAINSTVSIGVGALGLLIVQRMLDLHDSQIRLVEREDRGTTFCFELAATLSLKRVAS